MSRTPPVHRPEVEHSSRRQCASVRLSGNQKTRSTGNANSQQLQPQMLLVFQLNEVLRTYKALHNNMNFNAAEDTGVL